MQRALQLSAHAAAGLAHTPSGVVVGACSINLHLLRWNRAFSFCRKRSLPLKQLRLQRPVRLGTQNYDQP